MTSRLGLDRVAGLDGGVFGYLFLAGAGAVMAAAVVVALARGSLGAGVQAAVWTALLGSLAMFAVAVPESVTWYRELSGLILAGDGIPLRAVGENLRNFTWLLILLPLWWLPFGLLGASLGRTLRRLVARSHRTVH